MISTLAEEYLERNNGNRTAALLDLTAGFMRGNPDEMRTGYTTPNAILAAAKALGSPDVENIHAVETAADILDALAAE